MNLFAETLAWLANPENWAGPNGIPLRTLQHLGIVAFVILAAILIALPVGILIGHARRGAGIVGTIVGGARAVPTLGLLTLLGLILGIGLQAPLISLIVLAIPSILAGAYAGVQAIDQKIPSTATAIGMNHRQVIWRVEIPLALPVIVGGIRSATLQVVSTATLAAYISDFGLGRYLFAGLKSRDYPEMLGGAILVTLLALLLEIVFAVLQRFSFHRIANPAMSKTHSLKVSSKSSSDNFP